MVDRRELDVKEEVAKARSAEPHCLHGSQLASKRYR